MFASVFALDVAYVSHMLQEYVPMVLVVSILCCSSVSCCKLQVFYLDVAYVSHTCFKRMFQMFSSASDVCCIQVFHISEVESHGA